MLFLDEVATLQDAALISVLRQLRAGFPDRPTNFPWSLALIGLRDVRDYKVASGGSGLHTASPFNIKKSLTTLPRIRPTWLKPDGGLDADKLLEAFLKFWRQHGQPLLAAVHYHEVAPHIVMMAFLHRVVNGSGTLEREYAIGSGRMDLCLRYGDLTLAMELKVWRDGRPDPLKEGLSQLDERLSGLGLDTGWLVIFDQRSGLPDISERTTTETATTPLGRHVTVIRG